MCNMSPMPWRARQSRWFGKSVLLSALCCAAVVGGAWMMATDRHPPAPRPERPVTPATEEVVLLDETQWVPPERSERWKVIVIHHSGTAAGGADRFEQWHRTKGWKELGYHFVIGNGTDTADGEVEVGARWLTQIGGAHTLSSGNYHNRHGIGICLVGNFDNRPPGERQMASLRQLVAFLCREYKIPPDRIHTHRQVTGQTNCPGKHFDVDAVRRGIIASPAAVEPGGAGSTISADQRRLSSVGRAPAL